MKHCTIADRGGRACFVSPSGAPFFSTGINHTWKDLLNCSYNREVFGSRYGGSYEAFYKECCRDLERWGMNTYSEWEAGPDLLKKVMPPQYFGVRLSPEPISYWDCWTSNASEGQKRLITDQGPLTVQWDISHNKLFYPGFADVFDQDAWEKRCLACVAAKAGAYGGCENLLGYYCSDIPIWTPSWWWYTRDFESKLAQGPIAGHVERFYRLFERGGHPSYSDAIRALPAGSAGKTFFIQSAQARYGTIEHFNRVYGKSFESFAQAEACRSYAFDSAGDPDAYRRDDLALLGHIADRYYGAMRKALRALAPGALLLGDRFDADAGVPDTVLVSCGKYCDAICLEYYQFDALDEHINNIEKYHRAAGKPVLLCDSCYCSPTEGLPGIIGPVCRDKEEIALHYERYIDAVFALPYVLGWHWCGYIDRTRESEYPLQHSGLKDRNGEEYRILTDVIAGVNARVHRKFADAQKYNTMISG